MAILIDCKMDGPERAPSNFLFYEVLVDAMLSGAIIMAIRVFGTSVKRFLVQLACCQNEQQNQLSGLRASDRVRMAHFYSTRSSMASRMVS